MRIRHLIKKTQRSKLPSTTRKKRPNGTSEPLAGTRGAGPYERKDKMQSL